MQSRSKHPTPRTIRTHVIALIGIVLCLVGCTAAPDAQPTPNAAPLNNSAKQIATVYISPTPNSAEQQATQSAAQPTETITPTISVPTPTPYIGVFLGDARQLDNVPLPENQPAQRLDQIATTQPIDRLSTCPIPPDPQFGSTWQESPAASQMGCPAEYAMHYNGSMQIFERGMMYFNPTGMIWVIATNDLMRQFWIVPQAPDAPDQGETAPSGLRVPRLGFGSVWRSVAGVRDALGYARTDETSIRFSIQHFQNGTLFADLDAGQVFILSGVESQGAVHGPY